MRKPSRPVQIVQSEMEVEPIDMDAINRAVGFAWSKGDRNPEMQDACKARCLQIANDFLTIKDAISKGDKAWPTAPKIDFPARLEHAVTCLAGLEHELRKWMNERKDFWPAADDDGSSFDRALTEYRHGLREAASGAVRLAQAMRLLDELRPASESAAETDEELPVKYDVPQPRPPQLVSDPGKKQRPFKLFINWTANAWKENGLKATSGQERNDGYRDSKFQRFLWSLAQEPSFRAIVEQDRKLFSYSVANNLVL